MTTTPKSFTFLDLLTLISSLKDRIPKAIALINALIEVFAPATPKPVGETEGLEMTNYSTEEQAEMQKITQALAAPGTQPLFDGKLFAGMKRLFESAKSLGSSAGGLFDLIKGLLALIPK